MDMQIGKQPPSRRSPRVRCETPVWVGDTEGQDSVEAVARDVSEGGMRVTAPWALPVGAPVTCKVSVDGESIALEAQVVWRHGPDPASHPSSRRKRPHKTQPLYRLGETGMGGAAPEPGRQRAARPTANMGIRFMTVGDRQAEVLNKLIRAREPVRSQVQLFFQGREEPVRAHAEVLGSGLRLVAPLPILAPGTEVGYRLKPDDAKSRGRIRDVALDRDADGKPRLRIEVAGEGAGATEAADEWDEPTVATRLNPETKGAPMRRPARSVVLAGAALVLVGFALGWGTGALWLRSAQPPPQPPRAELQRASAEAPALEQEVVEQEALEQEVVEQEALEQEKAAADQENTGGPRTLSASVAHPGSAHDRAPIERATGPASKETPAEPGSVGAAGKPEIRVAQNHTRLRIPVAKARESLRTYALTSPGIAITLPGARPRIPFDNYGVYRGLVKRVWVRPYEDGMQVRVIFKRRVVRHEVRIREGVLEVLITP